ncbi:helix-turn-helix domain-containing protein [Marinicrinis lubricantis]|uniref:Helix-turn-helix domain-containing protein n=1 Tax=Marinicrinis lubricantis TaxID=2086470 RepID=A0ABW1IPK2_9BACL
METTKQLLTVDEAREVLRVGRNVMYQLIKSNDVPHIKVGKQIRVPYDDFIAWIKNNTTA